MNKMGLLGGAVCMQFLHYDPLTGVQTEHHGRILMFMVFHKHTWLQHDPHALLWSHLEGRVPLLSSLQAKMNCNPLDNLVLSEKTRASLSVFIIQFCLAFRILGLLTFIFLQPLGPLRLLPLTFFLQWLENMSNPTVISSR